MLAYSPLFIDVVLLCCYVSIAFLHPHSLLCTLALLKYLNRCPILLLSLPYWLSLPTIPSK